MTPLEKITLVSVVAAAIFGIGLYIALGKIGKQKITIGWQKLRLGDYNRAREIWPEKDPPDNESRWTCAATRILSQLRHHEAAMGLEDEFAAMKADRDRLQGIICEALRMKDKS